VLILSLAASFFMTPEHYKREVIDFVNSEGLFSRSSYLQENGGENNQQEVLVEDVKGTENSLFKKQELETQYNQNQGELLRLREENKKLQKEIEKFVSQSLRNQVKPSIGAVPKGDEGVRPSQTTIATYIIRGASLLVTVCFFGFLLRHFFFPQNKFFCSQENGRHIPLRREDPRSIESE